MPGAFSPRSFSPSSVNSLLRVTYYAVAATIMRVRDLRVSYDQLNATAIYLAAMMWPNGSKQPKLNLFLSLKLLLNSHVKNTKVISLKL